jgi:hypothetical protein
MDDTILVHEPNVRHVTISMRLRLWPRKMQHPKPKATQNSFRCLTRSDTRSRRAALQEKIEIEVRASIRAVRKMRY